MELFSFEQLNAYKASKHLVISVYKLIAKFPQSEKFALCQQLQRAIVSVASNLAEGSGRNSYKEKIHFLEIAYGSLMEAYCQIDIALSLEYITGSEKDSITGEFWTVSRLISGLKNSFTKQL